MAQLNEGYSKLTSGYLFPEIARRSKEYLRQNPTKKLLRLGIGNTTEALSPTVAKAMQNKIQLLSNRDTYTGYGDEQGDLLLRQALVDYYKKHYNVNLSLDEIFVSDGGKSDTANIQSLFSQKAKVAVQDPSYPVYIDTNVVSGRSSGFDSKKGQYKDFVYLACNKANGFCPMVPKEKVDLIYLCSPNNPTGAVMNKDQLTSFVEYALKNKSVIIFDSAYCEYIEEDGYPHSIYEISGAEKCAIEICSFSKFAGFTGVRLGWSIVPKAINVAGDEGTLNKMWNRRQCTFFNGASNIAQAGGIAALSGKGYEECVALVNYYKDNAKIIIKGLTEKGFTCHGGVNSPYVWVETPNNMSSWDFFDVLLKKCSVICTPGVGFGPSGEGFVRLSSYGHKEDIIMAVDSIRKNI